MHKTGAAAGLFALVAVFWHMQFAPQSETGNGLQKIGEGTSSQNSSQPPVSEEPIEGPWLATRAYFNVPQNTLDNARKKPLDPAAITAWLQTVPSPAKPSIDPHGIPAFLGVDRAPKDAEMWSVVATVPDPLHTRMALFLDGQIEAMERSLQPSWEFAGQWLPWIDHFDGSEHDINERRRQRRLQAAGDEVPGILIFRGTGTLPAKEILFVLLVPETATSGINGKSFFAALNLASILTSPKNNIGLLAPTFSGSFSSLAELVQRWKDAHFPETRLAKIVYSGAVSNNKYADKFKVATKLEFHAGNVDSQDSSQVFCEVLTKYHIDPNQAALLKEDETGYSNSFSNSFTRPAGNSGVQSPENPGCLSALRTYYFPRDISHLRNAYQENNTSGPRDPYIDTDWNLNFSIRDPNSGEDSIPTFSEVQTPLVQNALVSSIAQEFKQNGTEIVFIVAANRLDTLFLMRMLRRTAPDTRILVENPDVLFIPAASQDPLTGSLLLSSYPMFPDGEAWLDRGSTDDSKDRIRFADPADQGIYNVTRLLLHDLGAPVPPQLLGYGQFQGGHPYPGMWLLTLNRYGFLPIDYRQDQWAETKPLKPGACGTKEDCGWLRQNPNQTLPRFPDSIVPPRSWRITIFAVNVLAVLACFFFLRSNLSPAAYKPHWLALTEGLGIRLQVLFALALSLTAGQWILISPELFPPRQLFGDSSLSFFGILFGLVALIGLAAPLLSVLFVGFVLERRYRAQHRKPQRRRLAVGNLAYPAIMLGVFLIITGGWTYLCYRPEEASFFIRFRSLDLYSGSSPATPLVLLAAIVCSVSVAYFKRYTVGGAGRPRFVFTRARNDSRPALAFQQKLHSATEALEQFVLAPSRFSFSGGFWRTVVGLIFLLVCLRVLGTYPSAFEPGWYNVLLWIELSLVLYWLAIGSYDLWFMWKRLRSMLDLIELLRLQPGLKRVVRDWPRRPVWAFRSSVSRHRLNRQMLYALHRRVVVLKNLEGSAVAFAVAGANGGSASGDTATRLETTTDMAEADFEVFRSAVNGESAESSPTPTLSGILSGSCLPGAAHVVRNLERYQRVSAGIAARMLQEDLRPWWRQSLEEEDARDPRAENQNQESVYLKSCSDFVALQCCRYVAWGVEHIQRIASCVSITFVLLLLFFNSYSPQGPEAIARFFAVLFLVLGYLIIRVLAQMERNPILSRIARTNPGELNAEFWMQLLTLGGLPFLGVLAHLFPSISEFLFRWIAPGVQAVR